MLHLYATLTLLAVQASAGDFRALNFGDPCSKVRSIEMSAGAIEITSSKTLNAERIEFSGNEFDRDVTFTYDCPAGKLFGGSYLFPVETLVDGLATYKQLHEQASKIYGVPFVDSSPWQTLAPGAPIVPDDPRTYLTTWRTPRVSVRITIHEGLRSRPNEWRVTMSFKPGPNVRSNNSLERTRGR